jgi:hypothetical protein
VELSVALANQRRLLETIAGGDEKDVVVAVDDHLAAFEEVMLGQRLDFLDAAIASVTGSRTVRSA